jgi:CheY-like chemotaxis protein
MAAEKRKILIMDDEAMVGEIACHMLRFFGFEGVWVAEGGAAVAEYQRQLEAGCAYAAVIVDLTVPQGMGGSEASAQILALDPNAKIFVSSGFAGDPIMVDHRRYGFIGAIDKPFDMATVQRLLEVL